MIRYHLLALGIWIAFCLGMGNYFQWRRIESLKGWISRLQQENQAYRDTWACEWEAE